MGKLVLVKHLRPEIEPSVPSDRWRLGVEGRRRCRSPADRLAAEKPTAIVASGEPKAIETAALLAARLRCSVRTAPGLHEHDREGVEFLGEAAFDAAVAEFFRRPRALVLGRETADGARNRFLAAVDRVLAGEPTGAPVIVTHGTVIALFVAAHNDIDPSAFWRGRGLPSFVVLARPGFGLLTTVAKIGVGSKE